MAELWIAGAVVAAAVVGGVATGIASSSAADSAAQANKTNQDIANANNALNYQMFLQGRGSQGSALLPMYFPSGTEQWLGNQAASVMAAEQQASGTPTQQLAGYNKIVQDAQPSVSQGDQLVNQLFSGELANQEVANQAPVAAARGAVAGAQKTGILEGLMQRLNALSADRARAGYVGGGSSFQKNLLTNATIPALQGAATVGAQADLANATDVAAIKQNDINTRLNNVNLPIAQAANKVQLAQLPNAALSQNFRTSLQPFDWFKLQPQAFSASRPPLVTPVPGTGQVVGSGIAAGASTLGTYFQNRALINQIKGQQTGGVPQSQLDQAQAEFYGVG